MPHRKLDIGKLQPVNVLAIGAHPDDIELGCGGTLLRLSEHGYRVGAVDLTGGELGTRGTMEQRLEEATRAARALQLLFRQNLGWPDGGLEAGSEWRLELIRLIRQTRPEMLVTHSPFGHPDHRVAAGLVKDAAHHAGLAKIETGQKRHRPSKIAAWLEYTQPAVPDVVVDISEVFERKEEAVRLFASQLFDPDSAEPETYLSRPDFLDQIRSHNRHMGNLVGCRFGEGFLLSRLPKLDDLLAC